MAKLKCDDVEWVVNDNAELGVKIGDQLFFMYKGRSLEYEEGKHDDGTPIKYRPIGKREFGECCHPWNAIELKQYGNIYNPRSIRLPDSYIGFHGEDETDWKEIPVVAEAATQSYWVLECKEVDLYFGTSCGKLHYAVGISDAKRFASKEDAEFLQKVLKETVDKNYDVTEHMDIVP